MNNVASKKINSTLKFVYSDNNSLSVIFQDNDLLMGVVGEFNENLKELERITNTSLYSRGNSILIKSTTEKNEITKNAIQFLVNQFIKSNLIDELIIFTMPVLLGEGIRLFEETNKELPLVLTKTKSYKIGVIESHYERT